MRGGGRGRPIQGNLARAAIVAEIVRLGGKQLRQIAREGGMGNAIRKEFGQRSHMKSALGGCTPRAKKIVKVVPVQNGERVRIVLRTLFMDGPHRRRGKGSVGSRKD